MRNEENESSSIKPAPAAPDERDKALAQEILQQVIAEGLDEKYLLGILATVRIEERERIYKVMATALDPTREPDCTGKVEA